jgi:hypothetical protein
MTGTMHVAGAGEILTFSGKYVTPLNLQPSHVDIEDIAHALSNQCRYSGHVSRFYSVAQHSVHTADILAHWGHDEATQFQGLMHDAAEAYLQDMARPLKEDEEFGRAYRTAEKRAETVIAACFGYAFPFPDIVKYADLAMLALERKRLMPSNGHWKITEGLELPDLTITPWSPTTAESVFLAEFYRLTNHREES